MCSKASVPAAETWLVALGRERFRLESDRQHSDRRRAGLRSGVSCGTVFLDGIAIELAEQGIAVFFSPICKVRDEVFHLLASSIAKSLDSAEVGRIRLDQSGVELVLPNQLAKPVANLWPA